jgi:hypothetical protein
MPRKRKPAPVALQIGDLVQHTPTGTTGTLRAFRCLPSTPDQAPLLLADVHVYGRVIPCAVRDLRRIDRSVYR